MQNPAELTAVNNKLLVKGDINFSSVMDIYMASLPHFHSQKDILIDFQAVTSVDSAGLALMMEWLKQAKQNNQRIQFEHVPAALMAIAKVADVEKFLI